MVVKKKKGQAGEAVRYITRNQAIKKLQLRLSEFNRLCIYKGIYPREPKSRKKAQKGDTQIKTLYLKDDINFLQHEPLLWMIRNENIHRRKLKTVRGKKERAQLHHLANYQKPTYKLDPLVLERYPSFEKALQDLDDPLSTCFLYAVLPAEKDVRSDIMHLCRRLTVEFMHYVIEAKALRKAFISVKGYFYRAHIQGEKITWCVPHVFTPENKGKVSMSMITRFVEFYATLLGFVNFKLYQSLNLRYPPKLATKVCPKATTSREEEHTNILESLSIPLGKRFADTIDELDDNYDETLMDSYDKKLKVAEEEQAKTKKQIQLFKDIKFYLGRETNRESLTFVIRSAGGLVSFDATLGSGATYKEDDKEIMYQIVDRPNVEKKYLSRYYVQPQWVYDSFNNALLMPVQNYFPGVELPAHLSPFEESFRKEYVPPEKHRLNALTDKVDLIGDKSLAEMDKDFTSDEEEVDQDSTEGKKNSTKGSGRNIFAKGTTKMQSIGEKGKPKKNKSQKKEMVTKKQQVKNKENEKEDQETEENDHESEEMETQEPEEMETQESEEMETQEPEKMETKEPKEMETQKTKIVNKKANRMKVQKPEKEVLIQKPEKELTEEKKSQNVLDKMQVQSGKPEIRNEKLEKEIWEKEDFRLASSFIHRKQRRLFKKILKKERERERKGLELKQRRVMYEKEMLRRRKIGKTKAKNASRVSGVSK